MNATLRKGWRVPLAALSLCLSCTAVASAGQLQDPMRPPGISSSRASSSVRAARDFTLSSTFITRNHKGAIINGRRVATGDMIGGARIIEILPTEVRLRRNGRVITLRLLPITVKRPALTE